MGAPCFQARVWWSTINPATREKSSYDPIKDFAPISLLALAPLVVAVHPSLRGVLDARVGQQSGRQAAWLGLCIQWRWQLLTLGHRVVLRNGQCTNEPISLSKA
jgi:hypothetical protein